MQKDLDSQLSRTDRKDPGRYSCFQTLASLALRSRLQQRPMGGDLSPAGEAATVSMHHLHDEYEPSSMATGTRPIQKAVMLEASKHVTG
jgi:hypothetical protein